MQPFVAALCTAFGLTSQEIADIIWLALHMQDSDEAVETTARIEAPSPTPTTDDRPRPAPSHRPDSTDSDESPDLTSPTKSAELHLNQPSGNQAGFGQQLTLNVPDARSLREPLSLARSLKPLLQRVVTGWSTELDEAATVERIADEQLWLPVLKPALEPWLDLALVVDESESMQIWQRTIAELQRLLSHYGVFRDVRVWGLVTEAGGEVRLRPGLGAAGRRQAARRPSELIDPSGRRLILVATDCVAAGWQEGRLLPTLKLWATSGPLAIVQMLPEWLWSRTGLGFAAAVRLQGLLPGVPNQQLVATDGALWDEVDLEVGIKVPVVTLEPEPFGAWTAMVAGKGSAWSPGFVFEPSPVTVLEAGLRVGAEAEDAAEQRVQRFRVTASPMARRLAGLLAAAPVISLPVVRIIQDRLLAESRQVHVAEVFLGGLLRPLTEMGMETNPDTVQYEFWDGVRKRLLESVPTSDSVNVLQEVSQFVAERLGLSVDAFIAVLRNPQQAKSQELASQSRPFAMVTAQILRPLGGKYANFAKELERQHTEPQQTELQRTLADIIWKQKQQLTSERDLPCLSLAVAPLKTPGHFAIHIIRAPYPGGYVLNDSHWPSGLEQLWQGWQEMFSTRALPAVPRVSQVHGPLPEVNVPAAIADLSGGQPTGRAGRLMQTLGMGLWQWLFEGSIQNSLNHSQGIAMGQNKPLRLRLEVRDPEMISIPWEIMQDGAGKQAVSLSQQVLFSRTTSDVSHLPPLRSDSNLKILLVLGQNALPATGSAATADHIQALKLEQEAEALAHVLKSAASVGRGYPEQACQVDILVQPTPADLIESLETRTYNVLFYAGHGMPAPDGGLLFLRPEMTLNGTELAQVLTRCQVKLAVFNACWGAQPDHQAGDWSDAGVATNVQAIPRSSLAEVLIHHGVPAVLGMRDSITDEEALSFIQTFAWALAHGLQIDQAVAVARQQLLTLYKFNQQAWTLPVLYMHPQFQGELLKPLENPEALEILASLEIPVASLRSLRTAKVWPIHRGIIRVGRSKSENDLVLQEDQGGVSRQHAVIFCRHSQVDGRGTPIYFLEDFSTFGTWISRDNNWVKVHREEVTLVSGNQIKFGSSQNEVVEFIIHGDYISI